LEESASVFRVEVPTRERERERADSSVRYAKLDGITYQKPVISILTAVGTYKI
jgi:hypothetical protein